MNQLENSDLDFPEAAWAFVASPDGQSAKAFSQLLACLRQGIETKQYDRTAVALKTATLPALGYTQAQSLYQIRRTLRGKIKSSRQIKIAVLGSFTTKQLVALLDLFLFAQGLEASFYEGEFGTFRQDIIDVDSELYRFAPQVLFLATSWRDLGARPHPASNVVDADAIVSSEFQQWANLWRMANQRAGCQIIQNNFVSPPQRAFANHEMRQRGSAGRFVLEMNRVFADSAPAYVTIHDADHLAASAGRLRWEDPRFFHQAKMPCNPECLVEYAHSVASLIAAQSGLTKKCLVLDLDNTLWGGVIGDDGLGGIRLGQGDAEGEAFLDFQRYVLEIRKRGILIAVCSKNTESVAMEVFDQHSEMVLRRSDISCFAINWDDKAANLRRIAAELNIGLDSLVFVDDNPAERAIVRQLVPEVAVPELPEDVSGYVHAIDQQRYFQVIAIAGEDFQRTDYYKADSMRRELETSATDMESYHASLRMVGRIEPISAATLERAAQLTQRSNQFNLTTRRRSASELSAIMADPAWITRTVSLADRFGDNGLISVLLAEFSADALEIDTWLMSCRVLKRGVESFLLNHLCEVALAKGLPKIRGSYLPSPKNALVKDHFAGLGFKQTGALENGQTTWELSVIDFLPLRTFIQQKPG
jgi:FkbH-like protein